MPGISWHAGGQGADLQTGRALSSVSTTTSNARSCRVGYSAHRRTFNTQLAQWLVRANHRQHRVLQCRPADRIEADKAVMLALPPVGPSVGWRNSTRLPRDHYIRLDGNDYSVHPGAVGRRIEVTADLGRVRVWCAGVLVADHERIWAKPFEPEAANLFFQLVSSRYERASLIVTSNKPFGRWGEVFGDDVVAAAMIDRLVHHAEVIALKGDSYRIKDRDLGRVPTVTTDDQ